MNTLELFSDLEEADAKHFYPCKEKQDGTAND